MKKDKDIPTGRERNNAAKPPLRNGNFLPSVPLEIKVTRINITEIGSSIGNVQIEANGFSFSIGIMEGSEALPGWWCAWPSRRGRNGRSYPLLWAVNNDLRYAIEREALLSFKKKYYAQLYADHEMKFGPVSEQTA